MIFANDLLPVFLIAGARCLVGWLTRLDTQPLGKVVFYMLGPALIFHSTRGLFQEVRSRR